MSRSELSKEFREIRQLAEAQGWTIDRTTSLHWRFKPPCSEAQIVTFSGSPSDHRAIKNFMSKMRSNGLNVARRPPRRGKKGRK